MNVSQSLLQNPESPQIVWSGEAISLKTAIGSYALQSPKRRSVITAEQVSNLLGAGRCSSHHSMFSSVPADGLQLGTIASHTFMVPVLVPLTLFLEKGRVVRSFVTMESGLLGAAEHASDIHEISPGYRIILRDMNDADRKIAISITTVAGLRSETLSLSTAVTAFTLATILLGHSLERTYETRTRLRSGEHFAVGPGKGGTIKVLAVREGTHPPALGFVQRFAQNR